jgi:hypothetical protein
MEREFRRPMTSNLLPDLASTHSPLTYDLSLKMAGFLSCRLVSLDLRAMLRGLTYLERETVSHYVYVSFLL